MKYNLICDESGTGERYLVVGGLSLPRTNHEALAQELLEIKKKKGLRIEGEFKWGKVSKSYLIRYMELLEWFFQHLQANHLRFRAHVVDTSSSMYRHYGEGDKEKSFYKVYYHLLRQTVRQLAADDDVSSVLVLLDDKVNRYRFRLPVLKRALNSGLKRQFGKDNLVANVEPRHSSGIRAEPLIQIVDVLIGAIGSVRNSHNRKNGACPAKLEMIKFLEELARTGFAFDTVAKAPFNLWTFDVAVAMAKRESYQKKNRSTT
jgi:Protein of unknown function (DUF3800)